MSCRAGAGACCCCPVAPVSPWASVGAIYVGLFANEVLPLHAGELIRCFLMARWSKIPISVTLASALIERIFDGVLLIAGLFLSLRYMRHFPLSQRPGSGHRDRHHRQHLPGDPAYLVRGAAGRRDVLARADAGRASRTRACSPGRMCSSRISIASAIRAISISPRRSAFLTCCIQIVPIYAIMQAYGFDGVSWAQAGALMVLLRLGSVVPQAPGNVGLFQVVSTLGLTLFGVPGPWRGASR